MDKPELYGKLWPQAQLQESERSHNLLTIIHTVLSQNDNPLLVLEEALKGETPSLAAMDWGERSGVAADEDAWLSRRGITVVNHDARRPLLPTVRLVTNERLRS